MNKGYEVHAVKQSTSVPYVCISNVPFIGEMKLNMQVKVTATLPDFVTPGAEFALEDSFSEVTFGKDEVPLLNLAVNPIKGEVQKFHLELENATSTDGKNFVNVAEGGLTIPETPFASTDPSVSFRVPADGGIDVNLKAGNETGSIIIKAGEIETLLNGNLFGNIHATCNPGIYNKDTDEIEEVDATLNVIPIQEPTPADTTPPVITLKGDNPLYLNVGDEFVDPGATATDDVDGDLTEQIVVTGSVDTSKPGEYILTYTVSDSAGNEATATRTVIVREVQEPDTTPPVITLKGDNPLYLNVGDEFVDPGATATDDVDGDLTEQIVVTGSVDTSKPGEYILTYTVSDSAGNTASVTRTVIVQEKEEEQPPAGGSWYYGEGAPDEDLGSTGDLYLDIASGDVYVKQENGWVLAFNMIGGDGSKIFTGTGAPAAELGKAGDYYLDTSAYDLYLKDESGWKLIGNLKGAKGDDGTSWHVGEGKPDSSLGRPGDFYIDAKTGDLYIKDSENGWVFLLSLKGSDEPGGGNPGDDEPQGGNDDEQNNGGPSNGNTGNNGSGGNDNGGADKGENQGGSGNPLPDTATKEPLLLSLGLLLTLLGGAGWLLRRRVFQ